MLEKGSLVEITIQGVAISRKHTNMPTLWQLISNQACVKSIVACTYKTYWNTSPLYLGIGLEWTT